LASTGRSRPLAGPVLTRRAILRGIAAAPGLALATDPVRATDYASAAEVFAAVDRAETEVTARLRALGAAMPSARAFTSSLLADLERHRAARAVLRRRLRLGSVTESTASTDEPLSLAALRAAQENLVYAHAEGLPAVGAAFAIDVLAKHMVDLSRHLTVTTLWIEVEGERG
jgi:hypothetical protein